MSVRKFVHYGSRPGSRSLLSTHPSSPETNMMLQIIVQTLFVALTAIITLCYMGKGRIIQRKALELLHGKEGCLPAADIGNVTLHYFRTSGKAEVIRLLMEETRTPYTETNYTKETWPDIKRKGTDEGLFTFGQVPVIVTDTGMKIAQTQAIVHYLGRAAGLDCDCEDYTLCEVFALGTADVRQKLGSLIYSPSHVMADRAHYFKEVMPVWLGYFEKLAPPLIKQKGAYFVADRLTWVDFLIFDVLDYNVQYGLYDFGNKEYKVDVLEHFPKLNNFYRLLASRPNIERYLKSDRRHQFVPFNLPQDAPKSS